MAKIIKSVIAIMAVIGGLTVANAQENKLDHIIWAVPDLEQGAAQFEQFSGVKPMFGGVHPGRGTRNNVVSAGSDAYFEIIAPDPAQAPFDAVKEPKKEFALRISEMPAPEVDMFVYSTENLEDAARIGNELGFTVIGHIKGSRRTTEGELVEWIHVDFIGHKFGQFIPFAINWGKTPHPGTTSPQGAVLKGVTVEHPENEELERIYKALGVPAEVKYAAEPRIIVHMDSEQGMFEVTSGKSLLDYYAKKDESNF